VRCKGEAGAHLPVGGLATAQHQDNQDDDHNEDDGADADIH
jgi:hypothetical protein